MVEIAISVMHVTRYTTKNGISHAFGVFVEVYYAEYKIILT